MCTENSATSPKLPGRGFHLLRLRNQRHDRKAQRPVQVKPCRICEHTWPLHAAHRICGHELLTLLSSVPPLSPGFSRLLECHHTIFPSSSLSENAPRRTNPSLIPSAAIIYLLHSPASVSMSITCAITPHCHLLHQAILRHPACYPMLRTASDH